MSNAVIVFAKVPVLGRPKSRLAREVGRDRAEEIYRTLLAITAGRVDGLDHFVSFAGADQPGALAEIFPKARAFLPQQDESLGLRVQHALQTVRDKGYANLCAIGTDCPHLEAGDMESCFSLLSGGKDVVIGPALDGGYYLVGVKNPDSGIFAVEGWSTSSLTQETVAQAKGLNLACAMLRTKRDIDTLDDYRIWQSESE
jgi:rSAM/selenodomain-associated transferase 1